MKKLTEIILITVSILLLLATDTGAQGIDINAGKRKGLFLGLSLSPATTSILNEGSGPVTVNKTTPAMTVSAMFEAGYSVSGNISFSTGIGFSSLSSSFEIENYTNSYDTTDSELENYKRIIDGSRIHETQKITFLTVPLNINIVIPVSDKFGFYFRPGLNVLFNLNSTYENSGTFDYSGYYSKYNVTISDVPFEGFETGVNNTGSGELMIKSLNYGLNVSAGADIKLLRNLSLTVGVDYHKILSAISGYPASTSFKLSTNPDQMNSIMAVCDDISASSFGIGIGIRYFFK